jgi:CRP-like cAMP-binding protein
MTPATTPSRVANRALAALPPKLYRRLAGRLESVVLTPQLVVHEAGEPIRHVYFPESGLVAILARGPGGRATEVAAVGREGYVGLPVLFGGELAPHRTVVQTPGRAWRIAADDLRAETRRSRALSDTLLRYADAFLVQVAQAAVCNGFHTVRHRCCRWLLMAYDRVEADDLPFTQKALATTLAVRVASVSEVTAALREAGLISYRRGQALVRITDRAGLEAASCECYGVIKGRFDLLFAAWGSPDSAA